MLHIRRLSFSNIVALLALVMATSSTAYALTIPKNSVGSRQLKNNTVKTVDVKDGSLLRADFRAGEAPTGPQGPQGPKGPSGTVGTATVQFAQAAADLANGAELSLDAHCPAGQMAIGGGTRGDLTNSELTKVTASRPVISTLNSGAPATGGTFTGWRGTFVNENNGAGIRPEVWVICVPLPATGP
jgi:hypothetical protein